MRLRVREESLSNGSVAGFGRLAVKGAIESGISVQAELKALTSSPAITLQGSLRTGNTLIKSSGWVEQAKVATGQICPVPKSLPLPLTKAARELEVEASGGQSLSCSFAFPFLRPTQPTLE